jgi:hypothetical protein
VTIGRSIIISAVCGAILGLLKIHGAPLLIAPTVCATMIYRQSVARRLGKR